MIHQYQLNGYNIVIDNNSGSIHWVDDTTYEIIKEYESGDFSRFDQEDVEEILPELKELINEGKLFSEDIFFSMAEEFKQKQSVLKAMCLHVAHDCNMDCQYCFAGKGEYGEKGMMSLEVGKKAIDFLIENSKGRKNLEVDFFGGEPLMNWQVVKELVKYGRSKEKDCGKNFRFTLTTNGLWLDDEVMEFSNKEMSNVVISLDGRKSTNDKMRNTKVGGGTYDIVVDKFKKLADSRKQKDYYMRGTYTSNNLDFSKDIIHMVDLGFKELSMEPVVAPDSADYSIKEEHLPILFKEYEKLAIEMIKRKKENRPFNFYHYTIDFAGGPCISKRISGCGVGTEYIAVTPEGDIYPCHQFVGDEGFKMGTLKEGLTNKEVQNQFKNCNVYSHEECKDCFAKLYCSGGCAANAYHFDGKVDGIYPIGCKLHRKRIECAIMMHIASLD